MNVRIFITGATGFIGSHVVTEALARGHEIMAVVRSETWTRTGVHVLRGTLENVPWKEVRYFRPDVCLHSAWISTPGIYLESPQNLALVEASKSFLRGAFEAGVRYSLVLGTCIEYEMTGRRLRENDSPIHPLSLYARYKNQLREELEAELVSAGLGLGWGRVFYPYGPGEHAQRFSSVVIDKLLREEKVVINTPNSKKDYIYISDLAAAILDVIERKISGPINLGTGIETPVGDFARTIGRILGREQLVTESSPPSPDPYPYVVADATRLQETGWKPRVDLLSGLTKLVEYKQHEQG